MPSDEFLARPGQSLSEHLTGVVENARYLAPAEATTPHGNSLSKLIETVAHLHDIGKLTPEFQEYVREEPDRPPTKSECHSKVGAILTYHALAVQGFGLLESTAGFYAVLCHHQSIPDIEAQHRLWKRKQDKYVNLQPKLQRIDSHARATVDQRLQKATNGTFRWDDVYKDDPTRYKQKFTTISTHPEFDEFYPLLQRVWATLTCADKLNAADVPVESNCTCTDRQQISFENDATDPERTLNELRSDAQTDVVETLVEQDTDSGAVFTLTLPTGFGKTFAGLKAALEYTDNSDGRVVYALPYTTILDQIDDEIQTQLGVSPLSEYYTLHHHLADTRTRIDTGADNVSDGAEALYAESWQSRLVLTTFVQLFESLAGPVNTQSIKLPALQDAVIIIDEPQVLPRDWWQLVTRLTDVLTTNYDATIILMTATQPLFIDHSSVALEPTELVSNTDRYFDFLEDQQRIEFEIDASIPTGSETNNQPVTPDEAGSRLVEQACTEGGTTLAIANTVQSTIELWTAVQESALNRSLTVLNVGTILEQFIETNSEWIVTQLRDNCGIEPLADELLAVVQAEVADSDVDLLTASLTAALRPIDRTLLIETIELLLEESGNTTAEVPVVVTSTQLVEAGVDLSFDQVYRDFAPLPSLVQAAGRCNREFETDQGRVVLWRLSSQSHDRLPSQLIYTQGGDRLHPTAVALECVMETGRCVQENAMITDGVEMYYETLHETDHRYHDRDRLVEAYAQADGETLQDASLIDEYSEDVLVLTSEAEREILQQYLSDKEAENYRRGNQTLATLQQLFASVPEGRAAVVDNSSAVIQALGMGTADLDEFAVVDVRAGSVYDLPTGAGLRD